MGNRNTRTKKLYSGSSKPGVKNNRKRNFRNSQYNKSFSYKTSTKSIKKLSNPYSLSGGLGGGFGVGLTSTTSTLLRHYKKTLEQEKQKPINDYGISRLGNSWGSYRRYLSNYKCVGAINVAQQFKTRNPMGFTKYPNGGKLIASSGSDLMVWITLASIEYWVSFVNALSGGSMVDDQISLFIAKISQTIASNVGLDVGVFHLKEILEKF